MPVEELQISITVALFVNSIPESQLEQPALFRDFSLLSSVQCRFISGLTSQQEVGTTDPC